MLALQMQNFTDVRRYLTASILNAPQVKTERWQGQDVRNNPAATSYELRNVCFEIPLQGIENLAHWRADTSANMPWADDHFLERVGGEPLNPGVQWANWPWASSADKHRSKDQIFNHTYMERLWPKWARKKRLGTETPLELNYTNGARKQPHRSDWEMPHRGIGFQYGDLQDVVDLLVREPFTRQAWIPLFFPEDTGIGDDGRKPCTLGYQFLVRMDANGFPELHMYYPLRSVDLVRHWPDDCYLAVRLMIWMLERCRARKPDFWNDCRLGTYAMHCTSLHIFENDRRTLGGQ